MKDTPRIPHEPVPITFTGSVLSLAVVVVALALLVAPLVTLFVLAGLAVGTLAVRYALSRARSGRRADERRLWVPGVGTVEFRVVPQS